jgi:hypothetical protein
MIPLHSHIGNGKVNNEVLFYQNIKKTMILVKYGNATYQMMLFFEEANYVYYTSG